MRRLAIPALLAVAVLLGAGIAQGEISQKGNLRITFSSGFSPRTLPRDRPAPISISVEGKIATTDGTQPPALRRMEFALNRNGRLSAKGLPACTSPQLQATTTQTALERCGPALVGRGHFGANVKFPSLNPFPAAGTMLAFNGRRGGAPAVLLHFYGAAPVQATFILPLVISHPDKGTFGTLLSANIPTLAAGVGSVTDISLKIGRNYTYRGQRRSYISASCAAPAGFPGALFSLARGSFHFADNRTLHTTVSGTCRVR
jgi:hypothetical protein